MSTINGGGVAFWRQVRMVNGMLDQMGAWLTNLVLVEGAYQRDI